jgi:hypothetical protein
LVWFGRNVCGRARGQRLEDEDAIARFEAGA